jgi:hypothetical protein
MLSVLCLAWFVSGQAPLSPGVLDVTLLRTSAPTLIADIDLGKLKGEPRQLAWSPDGEWLYLQTAEGKPPEEKLRHYTVARAGGAVTTIDKAPDWAVRYWQVKQDRFAPGDLSLEIQVDRRQETVKSGMGPAGALDRQSNPAGGGAPSGGDLAIGAHGDQEANVTALTLVGEPLLRWVNTPRAYPGTRFSWGAAGSRALVYAADDGRLCFFDAKKHRVFVDGPADVSLPAWSTDGARVAYLQKTGRKKSSIMWIDVEKR